MLNTFVIGATSQGLSDIVSFFNNQSSSGDVTNALGTAGIAFKIAMFVIMFIGAIAMAIWIGRIGIDILMIVTRGTKIAESKAISSLGTGEADSYETVGSYLKKNLLEIILVIVLITFLMTGWLFRLIAIALAGFGALGNKLFGLDIGGALSSYEAEAFAENVKARRLTSLKNQYDEEVGSARAESVNLYEVAKKGVPVDDPKYLKSKRMYTMHMARADILGQELTSRGGVQEFKVDSAYFDQHLRQTGDGICNTEFVDDDVEGTYEVTITCAN